MSENCLTKKGVDWNNMSQKNFAVIGQAQSLFEIATKIEDEREKVNSREVSICQSITLF